MIWYTLFLSVLWGVYAARFQYSKTGSGLNVFVTFSLNFALCPLSILIAVVRFKELHRTIT